ncbi:MAG: hypothetical protein ACTHJM_00105 [Marmoricola sp.]
MPERSENETTTTGQHAAVAPWSVRARLGILVLILGVVAAMTALIITNRDGDVRAVTTSNHPSSSTPTPISPSAGGTKGINGSGIGPVDSPTHGRTPTASGTTATGTSNTSLAAFESARPTQGTSPTAPRSSSSAPAPSSQPTPVQTTSPTPTPTKPTPTKRCIPNTKICFPAK